MLYWLHECLFEKLVTVAKSYGTLLSRFTLSDGRNMLDDSSSLHARVKKHGPSDKIGMEIIKEFTEDQQLTGSYWP